MQSTKRLAGLTAPLRWAAAFIILAAILVGYDHIPHPDRLTRDTLVILAGAVGAALVEKALLAVNLFERASQELHATLRESLRVMGSADTCAFVDFYANRRAALRDIIPDIPHAVKRILLLGINLPEFLHDTETLNLLVRKHAEGCDVRIVLLDPLCMSAVLRTIHECCPEQAHSIKGLISARRSATIRQHAGAYFGRELFRNSVRSFEAVRDNPQLEFTVRYTWEDPNRWLAVVDDRAYIQMLGQGLPPDRSPDDFVRCDSMPVQSVANRPQWSQFESVLDDFELRWLCAAIDLPEHAERLAAKETLLKDLMCNATHFSRLAAAVLDAQYGTPSGTSLGGDTGSPDAPRQRDSRRSPHRQCSLKPSPRLDILDRQSGAVIGTGTVVDFSWTGGLGLCVDSVSALTERQPVRLRLTEGQYYTIGDMQKISRILGTAVYNVRLPEPGSAGTIGFRPELRNQVTTPRTRRKSWRHVNDRSLASANRDEVSRTH